MSCGRGRTSVAPLAPGPAGRTPACAVCTHTFVKPTGTSAVCLSPLTPSTSYLLQTSKSVVTITGTGAGLGYLWEPLRSIAALSSIMEGVACDADAHRPVPRAGPADPAGVRQQRRYLVPAHCDADGRLPRGRAVRGRLRPARRRSEEH